MRYIGRICITKKMSFVVAYQTVSLSFSLRNKMRPLAFRYCCCCSFFTCVRSFRFLSLVPRPTARWLLRKILQTFFFYWKRLQNKDLMQPVIWKDFESASSNFFLNLREIRIRRFSLLQLSTFNLFPLQLIVMRLQDDRIIIQICLL